MCEPVSIGLGVAKAGAGMMAAKAKHDQAKAAADRQNQIQREEFQRQLQIKAHQDQMKSNNYKAQLASNAAARTAMMRQRDLNQQEATRASIANQQALQEKITEASFKSQRNLIKSIQAQGTVLASGQAPGQSMLLSLMNEDRQLGFRQAEINASLRDANKASAINQYGVPLDRYASDTQAINSLPGSPASPSASFAPIKKPDVQGPSKAGLFAGMLGAAVDGASTGVSTYGTYLKTGTGLKGGRGWGAEKGE